MKRTLFLSLTLPVLLTGVALTRGGWFTPRPAVAPRRATEADARDAAQHLRHGRPQHWRAFLLQH